MKSKTCLFFASILLCSVFLSFLVMVVRARSEYPIQSFGVIRTFPVAQSLKLGIYGASSSYFYDLTADQIASTYDVGQSFPAGPGDGSDPYVVKLERVKQLNPTYKALMYWNVMIFSSGHPDYVNTAINNGWILRDAAGNYLTSGPNYMADIGNPNYQVWLGDRIKEWINYWPTIWDGTMLDVSMTSTVHAWEAGFSARPINPRTGTYFTDAEVFTGYSQLINAVIAALGPSKLVLPNGIWNGEMFFGNAGYRTILSNVPQLNALGSEGPWWDMVNHQWYTEVQWKESVDMVAWVQDNFLSGHADRRFSTFCNVVDETLPSGSTQEQMMLFGYCSEMLAVKSDQNWIGFGFDLGDHLNAMMSAQKLRNIDMEEPSGNYYKIVGTSVYARDFSGGKVLVNPTDTSYTAGLDKSYVTYDGNTVSGSLTLIPHSGVILLNS